MPPIFQMPLAKLRAQNYDLWACLLLFTIQTQINDLLESAGFSLSNPYYIVQQGKVQTLVQMKAAERLALLEEVREYVVNTFCDPIPHGPAPFSDSQYLTR